MKLLSYSCGRGLLLINNIKHKALPLQIQPRKSKLKCHPLTVQFKTFSTKNNEPSSRSFQSSLIDLDGVKIHYTQTGNGNHNVLLLPGALGSATTDFLPQLEGLDVNKYNIISFDPQGYGKSRPPERDWPLLFLQRDAAHAADLMKVLDIPQYSVLGWSDGGITGLILASICLDNVQNLIIWGSNAYVTEKDIQMYRDIEDVDKWSKRMKEPFIKVYGEANFRVLWKSWVQAVTRYLTERKGDICIDSLPNIKCPTLIINGHKDPLVPQEHPAYLHKHIAGSTVVDWPQGKHNLHLRYANEFNELVEKFLDYRKTE